MVNEEKYREEAEGIFESKWLSILISVAILIGRKK